VDERPHRSRLRPGHVEEDPEDTEVEVTVRFEQQR
jgi:hypothetical protein